MASQPVPPFICVVHVYRADVRPSTWHLFFLSSLASSHCRPYEAQNSPQVFGTMSSKSITAEQSENAVQILPFLTSSQPSGSHGVVLDVGVRDGAGVGCSLPAVHVLLSQRRQLPAVAASAVCPPVDQWV